MGLFKPRFCVHMLTIHHNTIHGFWSHWAYYVSSTGHMRISPGTVMNVFAEIALAGLFDPVFEIFNHSYH